MNITSKELREKYLRFFGSKGHSIIKSASLIPENDPSVLFTTAGMHPLIPYLMGQTHPAGKRLTNVQKCVRTGDIDEVGDSSHLTFFEMLGNWSLGDYFKQDSIRWSYEFLTSDSYLGIDRSRLAVSVFAGDETSPRDDESARIWNECGIPQDRIFYLPKENNWWIAGSTGPCGPDTEIFFINDKEPCSDECSPACDCGRYLEIWNNVFMQYNRLPDGSYVPLAQRNVDTGMGLERTVSVLNGYDNVYLIDGLRQAMDLISSLAAKKDDTLEFLRAKRIIADHIRTSTFMLGDEIGVVPSNVDKGYVLRRLIRRAVRYSHTLEMNDGDIVKISKLYIDYYKEAYPELADNESRIIEELTLEEERFTKTLIQGEKAFLKILEHIPGKLINGKTAFRLYDTYGFPIELTVEYAKERGYEVDTEGFQECFSEHQQKSNAAGSQHFKGGLADNGENTTRLHTATHLLQAALRRVLGDEVKQKGSNITPERLRFDFSFSRPMTEAEVKSVEEMVNGIIERNLPVICNELSIEDARAAGAIGLFGDKYGEIVKVYRIGDFSMEMCGGPHASTTGELGRFVITKEQSSSAGVRRIKAELR